MFWFGETLTETNNPVKEISATRCIKNQIEEKLFQCRRDLYTSMDLVFFDTTAIYFEGEGGDTIGQYGLELEQHGKRFTLQVGSGNSSGKVFQAAGVAMPPVIRECENAATK